MPATTMVSQWARSVAAHSLMEARNSGVMLLGRCSQPRKSLPGQVPSSRACWALCTRAPTRSRAPSGRNDVALATSRRIVFISLGLDFNYRRGKPLPVASCRRTGAAGRDFHTCKFSHCPPYPQKMGRKNEMPVILCLAEPLANTRGLAGHKLFAYLCSAVPAHPA